MSKKGNQVTQIAWFLIAGFIFFFIIACSFGHGIVSIFKSSASSSASFDKLTETIIEVSDESNGISLKLADLRIEEDSAIYFFTDKAEMIEFHEIPGSLQNSEKIIARPNICGSTNSESTCVCLCKGFGEFKNECTETGIQTSRCVSKLDCKDSLDCKIIDYKIQDPISISELMQKDQYEALKKRMRDEASYYVSNWKGGFSIWRSDKAPYNFLIPSEYLDVYVVRNGDGTFRLCLDADCIMYSAPVYKEKEI